jgi:aspartate/methionine/tyrosine aminotransferase
LFDGSVHRSIASLLPDLTITVSGVSKSYSWTGGRVGWAVFPTLEEAQVFKNLNINYFSCIPAYNQMGAKMALESPLSQPAIAEMVAAFQERRNLVVSALNAIPGISCQNPKGAFYVFPNIGGVCESIGAIEAYEKLPDELKKRTSPSTLFQMFLLFRYHVASMDRKSFGRIGTEGMHFLRLSIATGLDDLKLGMERMAQAAKDRDGFLAFVAEGNRLN